MTPAQRAYQVYQSEPCARDFIDDLELHLICPVGYVYSAPEAFIMGRYVMRDWSYEDITNPAKFALTGDADCLHIFLAAGDISLFFTFEHVAVPWVSFERKNQLRFYPYEPLRNRLLQGSKAARSAATHSGLEER